MNTTTFWRRARMACRLFGYAIGATLTWCVFRLSDAPTPDFFQLLAWALLLDAFLNLWRLLGSARPLPGDEIQQLAALLGLKDPWRDPRAPESIQELAALQGQLGTDVGDRRSGKTTRMLLMALLSIERGRQVVLVGLNPHQARHLAGVLDGMIHRLWPGKAVKVVACSLDRLPQALQGRQEVDLYVDHVVWEQRDGERLDVSLLETGPVATMMPAGPDHAMDASGYLLGAAAGPRDFLRFRTGLPPDPWRATSPRNGKKLAILREMLDSAQHNPGDRFMALVASPGQEEPFLTDLWNESRAQNLGATMHPPEGEEPWRLQLLNGAVIEVRCVEPPEAGEEGLRRSRAWNAGTPRWEM
jgi:hypothetical protein